MPTGTLTQPATVAHMLEKLPPDTPVRIQDAHDQCDAIRVHVAAAEEVGIAGAGFVFVIE